MRNSIEPDQILSAQERIQELEAELGKGSSISSKSIMNLVKNPGALAQMFNLTEGQSTNVKALISGMGTAASVKYLSRAFGTELAAIVGAAVTAYIAKKAFGGK